MDAALIERFDRAFESVAGAPGADDRIGIAVSGGPDSLALLLLAHATWPGRVAAATVDHGLRPEAADEARYVAGICADMGVPHATLTVSVERGGGVQAGARAARYAALIDWARRERIAFLATAHHADDQAETLLMRLARGSGIGGLAGIRPLRRIEQGLTLVRPLLGFRRVELAKIVAEAGLTAIDDPSNRDGRFDRTKARALLGGATWLDAGRLAAAAAHAGQAEAALDWAAEQQWGVRATIAGDAIEIDPDGLPPAILRRLVSRAIEQVMKALSPSYSVSFSGPELSELIARLGAGAPATIAGVKAVPGPRWRFAPAPPRRNA